MVKPDGTIYPVANKDIKIKFKEPDSGWFHCAKFTLSTISDESYTFAATDEQTLWGHGKQRVIRSTDGGLNWSGITHGSTYGNAACFIDNNTAWVDLRAKEIYHYTDFTNANSFKDADLSSNTLAQTYDGWMAGCWANTYNSGLVAYPRAIIAFDGGFTDAETSLFYSTASIDMIKFHAMNREQFVAYGHDQLSSKTYLILKQNGQPIAKYEITPYVAQEKGMQSLRLMPDNTIYFTSNNKLFKVSMPFSVSVLSQNISQILAINNRLIYALYNSKIYPWCI